MEVLYVPIFKKIDFDYITLPLFEIYLGDCKEQFSQPSSTGKDAATENCFLDTDSDYVWKFMWMDLEDNMTIGFTEGDDYLSYNEYVRIAYSLDNNLLFVYTFRL